VIGVYFSFTLLSGFYMILKVTFEGLVMEAEKQNQTTRNSIKNKEKKLQKGVGKIKRNTIITTCTFYDLFTCLI
jgi:hypothetical protein